MQNETEQGYATVDPFDRILGQWSDLPGVAKTQPATLRAQLPLGVEVVTYIVQTIRVPDDKGNTADILFLEVASRNGITRLVVPQRVTDVIARQRDALTTKNRRKGARQAAATRKERGIVPGFLKDRGKGRKGLPKRKAQP
jgi:hypothetical protein